jgi:hypothetical protein
VDDTSLLAPGANETDSFVEVEDKKWTDEELKDDARPGRRSGKKMDLVVEEDVEDVVPEKGVHENGKSLRNVFGRKEKKKMMKVVWV